MTKLPSQVELAVNRHIEEHGCQLRDRPIESFTYHFEFELGNSRIYWWVGKCDVCHGVVRVRVDNKSSELVGEVSKDEL